MVLEIQDNKLEQILGRNKITVLDFYADWCGPCRAYTPIIKNFALNNNDVSVGKVNVDENTQLAVKYGVRSIPATVFLKNGQLMSKLTGVIPTTQLTEVINALK
tara:strand:+ start:8704 stop:9015 length:312 start_codon:yes stop_codon:yes gene_type:complete